VLSALNGIDSIGVDHALVDVERPGEVAAMLARYRPSLVINTAAYHNVDRCETHVDRAFAVNAVAVGDMASLCAASGIALAHISTDYVFDGRANEPYDESAKPSPINVYGLSKYAGEMAIGIKTDRAFIFRCSGLYGLRGSSTKGYTFVERIRTQALAGKPLRVVDDVVTTPSYTMDMALTIRAVLEKGDFGTYHVTNSGRCTWYEFASEILSACGIEASIERATSDDFPTVARRPRFSVLANNALLRAGIPQAPDWKTALHSYLKSGANGV
jgi:dTDP-4-dehydrorhamnose reductase